MPRELSPRWASGAGVRWGSGGPGAQQGSHPGETPQDTQPPIPEPYPTRLEISLTACKSWKKTF